MEKLPNKFTFSAPGDDDLYTASLDECGDYIVSWTEDDGTPSSTDYRYEIISSHVTNGTWKIVSEIVSNGVDENGKLKNFDDTMWKAGMRVVDGYGTMRIVIPIDRPCHLEQTDNFPFAGISHNGWNPIHFGYYNSGHGGDQFAPVEIYDAPEYAYDFVNFDKIGKLLWKRVNPNQERIDELTAQINFHNETISSLSLEVEKRKEKVTALKDELSELGVTL